MIGERLKIARRAAGLSLEALGARVGVSKMAISKYERGLDMPGSTVLLGLARELGVKTEYFFRPTDIQFSASAFRCRKSLPAKQKSALAARVQEWLERYVEAETIVGQVLSFSFPEHLNRQVDSLEQAEEVALELRQAWELGLDPIENLCEVLEDRGVKVGVVDGSAKFDAMLCHVDDTEPVMAVAEGKPGDRQRFSLAHELGHLILEVPDAIDKERAANRFAGALLVPAQAAQLELGQGRRRLGPYELHLLKHKYGLSMQAWVYRAKDLGLISPSAATSFFRYFRQQGWHRGEPGDPYPSEEPERLKRLVLRALAEDLITESRAAELLGRSLGEFRHTEGEKHAGFPVGVRG
jgi:Zn-dependent peptidase ImmA (M78 family)/DNA-binding XRE family transcriptional regulator